jgi:hypothetical protein
MGHQYIYQTIAALERIALECEENNIPHGLFAALYLKVTRKVQVSILAGVFEDGPRMERFDILFASRYLDAYDNWRKGKPITNSWKTAFEASSKSNLLASQHLLLGMNAHINLDLGIAAATVARGADFEKLKKDFDKINDILIELLEEVQSDINDTSPVLKMLDFLFHKKDEQFIGLNLRAARQYAWQCACKLNTAEDLQWELMISDLDSYCNNLGTKVLQPNLATRWAIRFIKQFERHSVAEQIYIVRN